MAPKPLRLRLLPGRLAVSRLDPQTPLPEWVSGDFCSLTRTSDELSVVCDASAVPAGIESESGWQAFQVQGPLAFGLTGILASIVRPLAEAAISIFAISSFDTDYVLVKEDNVEGAIEVLRQAGHEVERADMIP